ncbi:MAG: hypothetical protein UZ06_CHB003001265 [Chlorobi bacterium OLB6]|nr:MAG: hypothetical protein UZ06_CHB003001265 [Chlorobi bacterium OLB6]
MNLRITGLFVAAFLVMSVAITAAMRCDDNAKKLVIVHVEVNQSDSWSQSRGC